MPGPLRHTSSLARGIIAALLTLSTCSARGGPPAAPAPRSDSRASALRHDLEELIADAFADFRRAKGELTYSSEGHEAYASRLGLTGCSDPEVWRRPSGEIDFTCQLIAARKGLQAVRALLGRRARAIASALPAGWNTRTDSRAEPYEPFLTCREPTAALELTVGITPYEDGTYSAGLTLAKTPSGCPEGEANTSSADPGSSPAPALSGEPATEGPPDGFYLGSLDAGDQQLDVALQLEVENGVLSGSYYYFTGTPKSLTLKGTLTRGGAFRLEESLEDGKVTGLWTGTLAGGELRGTWKDPRKARCWRFHLVRSERASRYFEGPPRSVEMGSTGVLTYVTARIPKSEHRVPLLTSFRDPKVLSAINASLVGAASARCEDAPNDFFGFDANVSFAAEDVLGVEIFVSWFCQAAHPNHADRSLTVDLRTGLQIGRDDLFREDATPGEIAGVLFPFEISESRKLRGTAGAAEKRSREDECAASWTVKELADAGFSGFHLSGEGLVVAPDFPYVIAYCASEVTVPYGALAPIVAPGSPLARIVAAHAGEPLRYRIHAPATRPEDDVFYTPPKGSD